RPDHLLPGRFGRTPRAVSAQRTMDSAAAQPPLPQLVRPGTPTGAGAQRDGVLCVPPDVRVVGARAGEAGLAPSPHGRRLPGQPAVGPRPRFAAPPHARLPADVPAT